QTELKTILRLFMGIMFLFSGVSKLFPLEAFESITVQQGLVGWGLVPYFSRMLVSLELLLGLMFLLNIKLRRFTLPVSTGLLVLFTVYLVYYELAGNGGENCGCFGEVLPLSNTASIVKNIVFIAINAALLKLTGVEAKYGYEYAGAGYVVILSILMVVFPVRPYETVEHPEIVANQDFAKLDSVKQPGLTVMKKPEEKAAGVSSDSLKAKEKKETIVADTTSATVKKKEPAKTPLKEKYPETTSIYSQLVPGCDVGIKIIAFLSLDCDHCHAVATELNQKWGLVKGVGRHYLFLGSEDQVQPFFSSTGGSVNYSLLTPQKFFPHLRSAPPKVILLVNGNAVMVMEGEGVSVSQLINTIKEINLTYSK
ncbi:MAG: DoxX family membrane protein, partial [Ignavibacteriaceae bacterium]|nr:DoxX family membrane protein [Ignavibacteriaceae bacterium]